MTVRNSEVQIRDELSLVLILPSCDVLIERWAPCERWWTRRTEDLSRAAQTHWTSLHHFLLILKDTHCGFGWRSWNTHRDAVKYYKIMYIIISSNKGVLKKEIFYYSSCRKFVKVVVNLCHTIEEEWTIWHSPKTPIWTWEYGSSLLLYCKVPLASSLK